MEIVTTLPTGSRNLPQNLSLTLRHWHSRCNLMGERSRSVELPSEKSTGRFAVSRPLVRASSNQRRLTGSAWAGACCPNSNRASASSLSQNARNGSSSDFCHATLRGSACLGLSRIGRMRVFSCAGRDGLKGLPRAVAVLSMVGKNYRLTSDMREAAAALSLPLASSAFVLRQIFADAPGQSEVVWNMGAKSDRCAV